MLDLSHICDLHHSLRQCWIPNPLEWAQGLNLCPHGCYSDLFLLSHNGNSSPVSIFHSNFKIVLKKKAHLWKSLNWSKIRMWQCISKHQSTSLQKRFTVLIYSGKTCSSAQFHAWLCMSHILFSIYKCRAYRSTSYLNRECFEIGACFTFWFSENNGTV